MRVDVDGLVSAQAALNRAVRDLRTDSDEMLAAILAGISARTARYVPVNTGFLINSEVRATSMSPVGPIGVLSYTAPYAPEVHEGPQRNWKKPGASNLFLKKGAQDFIRYDLSTVLARYMP